MGKGLMGKGVMGKAMKQNPAPRIGVVLFAIGLVLYPLVFSGAFYRDIGVSFLLAAIAASAWNIVGGYAGQI
jgi:ABC-type branched-subunit amino acid transport system permease subunit